MLATDCVATRLSLKVYKGRDSSCFLRDLKTHKLAMKCFHGGRFLQFVTFESVRSLSNIRSKYKDLLRNHHCKNHVLSAYLYLNNSFKIKCKRTSPAKQEALQCPCSLSPPPYIVLLTMQFTVMVPFGVSN